ncbi:hypothetical protein [Pseudoxanthomonas sp.]|uniref:hypothetical protein n=1 Tax=Pseudoxanthomonas sp. TaxID=1871049 RepID=UPI002586549E|nr:hypothetical protein [Pseudoxanthomonas sp.]MCR6686784.1 hypothetical protein [Pseudoxanthomonas sp.]
MPNCPPSSTGSAPCRLEWRPSRWLLSALTLLSALAPLAVLGSDMPRLWAWPLALAVCATGLWQVRQEAGRPPSRLVLVHAGGCGDAAAKQPGECRPPAAADAGGDTLDGRPFRLQRIAWRGPLAFVYGLDAEGRRRCLAWWPDTLPPPARRELRLAAAARAASRRRRPMAP